MLLCRCCLQAMMVACSPAAAAAAPAAVRHVASWQLLLSTSSWSLSCTCQVAAKHLTDGQASAVLQQHQQQQQQQQQEDGGLLEV
jgi:hypothetical protein